MIKNIIRNLNKAYDVTISLRYLEETSRSVEYVPLISATINYISACYRVKHLVKQGNYIQTVEEYDGLQPVIENYYISLLLLLSELVFLPSTLGYRGAFTRTRYAANYGLVRIREVVGLRTYFLILSIVHWAIRGTIEGSIGYIVSKSAHLAVEWKGRKGINLIRSNAPS